jgi:hypothetical protein
MDVVSAVASFIAIGQALAAIPKIVGVVKAFTKTRQQFQELLSEVSQDL